MKCLSRVAKDMLPFYAGLHVVSKADIISFKIIYMYEPIAILDAPEHLFYQPPPYLTVGTVSPNT